ncbi:MAG: GAF domain-containing protein, partial [Chloroflexi bacterium]|nr:GAF domain-containing protein [Chloroflexota bacterium]
MLGSSLQGARKLYFRPANTVLVAAVVSAAVFVLVEAFRPLLYYVFPVDVYLTIHTLLEFSSVIVSFAVFVVNWQAYNQNRSLYALVIATGFLAVGLLDLMHLLSYSGMPAFVTPSSPEKAIDYWLGGRGWAVLVLLASAFVLPGRRSGLLAKVALLVINLGVAAAAFIVVSFFHQILPSTYIQGQGLTPLKIGLEYGVIGLTLVAIAAYSVFYRQHDSMTSTLILSALVVSVFSELALTLYTNVYDTFNLLGHVYKVVAYYLIFRALLVTSVIEPYKGLQQANEELAGALDQLNQRAHELGILNEVAATVSESLDLDRILSSTLDRVLALMHVEAGHIMLVREGSRELIPKAWRGIPDAIIEDWSAHPFQIGEGVAGMVAVSGTSIVGDDLSADRRVVRAVVREAGLHGFAVVPVKSKGAVLGILLVASTGMRCFAPSDVQILEAIGNQLGLAVENARLYEHTDEQLQKKVVELAGAEQRSRLLSEISALLNSSLDLSTTLNQLGRAVAEAVGDFVVIALKGQDERLAVPFAFHT